MESNETFEERMARYDAERAETNARHAAYDKRIAAAAKAVETRKANAAASTEEHAIIKHARAQGYEVETEVRTYEGTSASLMIATATWDRGGNHLLDEKFVIYITMGRSVGGKFWSMTHYPALGMHKEYKSAKAARGILTVCGPKDRAYWDARLNERSEG